MMNTTKVNLVLVVLETRKSPHLPLISLLPLEMQISLEINR